MKLIAYVFSAALFYGGAKADGDARPLEPFRGIRSSGAFAITVNPGAAYSANMESPNAAAINAIDMSVQNNILNIQFQPNSTMKMDGLVVVLLSSPEVSKLNYLETGMTSSLEVRDKLTSPEVQIIASGKGIITADVETSKLSIIATGDGVVKVSGSADSVTLNVEGNGNAQIRASDLEANTTEVTIQGGVVDIGEIKQSIKGTVGGTSRLNYGGQPQASVQSSGIGLVTQGATVDFGQAAPAVKGGIGSLPGVVGANDANGARTSLLISVVVCVGALTFLL